MGSYHKDGRGVGLETSVLTSSMELLKSPVKAVKWLF